MSKLISIRIPDDLYEQISKQADEENRTVSNTIVTVLQSKTAKADDWKRITDEECDDRWTCPTCGNIVHCKDPVNLYTYYRYCGRCGTRKGGHHGNATT